MIVVYHVSVLALYYCIPNAYQRIPVITTPSFESRIQWGEGEHSLRVPSSKPRPLVEPSTHSQLQPHRSFNKGIRSRGNGPRRRHHGNSRYCFPDLVPLSAALRCDVLHSLAYHFIMLYVCSESVPYDMVVVYLMPRHSTLPPTTRALGHTYTLFITW